MAIDFPTAARFDCDRCGDLASIITVVPPGAPDPQALRAGNDPGRDQIIGGSFRLSIDGPVHISHTWFESIDPVAALTALSSGDPVALYLQNREFAPFWCPECALTYCERCWLVWPEFDEGFYDATWGRCPANHLRIMDD